MSRIRGRIMYISRVGPIRIISYKEIIIKYRYLDTIKSILDNNILLLSTKNILIHNLTRKVKYKKYEKSNLKRIKQKNAREKKI